MTERFTQSGANVTQTTPEKIEFYRHNLTEKDCEETLKVLRSIFLSTGETVSAFEKKFAQHVDAHYAVGVMSCTHALELALRYYNIGPGDEVITTPMSFIATANTIEYVGATPVFVDVEATTGNIDVSLIEQAITPKTKAIIPVHLYGQLCDMIAMRKLADKYGLKIIEDAAHCIEGTRDGIRVGELGDVACYSFYATKNATSGEGGALSTNDPAMYEWLLMARQHGMSRSAAQRYSKKYEHYDMEFLGQKCNMSNVQAALLLHQMDRLDEYLAQKEAIAHLFDTAFTDLKNVRTPTVLTNSVHARHLYTIWVDPAKRDACLHHLQDDNIGVAVNFRPIHLMSYYRKKYGYQAGMFPVAEYIGGATITLPLYPKLTPGEIERIIASVKRLSS